MFGRKHSDEEGNVVSKGSKWGVRILFAILLFIFLYSAISHLV